MLTITGERREETRDKDHCEFHFGSFRRTVPLPSGTREDVTATYSDGVLEVHVPTETGNAPEAVKVPVTRPE